VSVLLDELKRLVELVEQAEPDLIFLTGETYRENHRDLMIEVYHTLNGDPMSVPWGERRDPLARRMPDVMAWCVMKVERRGLYERSDERRHIWPGQAHRTKKQAEQWCDFLSDFYYDTHQRDGMVEWEVVFAAASLGNVAAKDNLPVGTGYYERHPWVGTLPMERWTRGKTDTKPWHRKKVKAS
jgi:hypothetical protein